MFQGWDSFYLLTGGAAGGLIGLLFIVSTLTKGLDADSALRGASVYMTPIVFHLGVVLALSGLAAAPGITAVAQGVVLAAACVLGLLASARVIWHLAVNEAFRTAHWTDIWCYGVMPLGAYLALSAATAAIWLRPDWAARGIAISVLAILLLAIRNAWDLVTWISARGPSVGETPPNPPA